MNVKLAFDRILWRLAAITLAGVFSGCATMGLGNRGWYKPGGSIEERDRLLAAAEVQAEQAKAAYAPGTLVNPKETELHTVLTFMTAAGWSLVPNSKASALDHGQLSKNGPPTHTAPLPADG